MNRRSRGFTLIELLVVIAIISVLIALLLPAVQAARGAARRIQCVDNMKQIGLALNNYMGQHNAAPMGGFWRPVYNAPNRTNGYGSLVPLLPFMEQSALYNTINQDWSAGNVQNSTAFGTVIAVLQCPSESYSGETATVPGDQVYYNPPPTVKVAYSSYAACTGIWYLSSGPGDLNYTQAVHSHTGVIHLQSTVGYQAITDGTSNTLAFGERTRNILSSQQRDRWSWWMTSHRTSATTMWPMNPGTRLPNGLVNNQALNIESTVYPFCFSSQHPGGCNFVFADGSVRLVKETIDSWPIGADGLPLGVTYGDGLYKISPGTRLGVFQALSTRSGGEVISADAY